MEIPILNIYYLLCYAWNRLDERDVVNVQEIEMTSLVDLFARVLLSGTNHLLKRGFDRGYLQHREWAGRIRGRICFQEVVKAGIGMTARLPCDYDELSYNVLHNRILKATMKRLLRVAGIAKDNSEGLAQICRRLSEVDDVEMNSRLFGQVQLYRNNQFYEFLLRICELIHRNLQVSEKTGKTQFKDFVKDKKQMAALYEAFVRNFYKLHTKYRVKKEDIHWRWVAADQVAAGFLPKMQTDISLTSESRKIIIDCKYTPEATQQHYESETLRSAHLYQINAYLDNLPPGTLTDNCEMMLLYPTVSNALNATFTDPKGRKISIRTINLNQPWQGIHNDLLVLVA